ncbi:MAG: hypothetical protein JXX29_15010 [Deltaproteobacteria bacterium]|nr:hypothetical protein [Deltaproteobacteria bacterium]
MKRNDFESMWGDWPDDGCVKVQVTRKEPRQYAGYLGTMEIYDYSEANELTILNRYGGGTYYLQFRNAQSRYDGHRTFEIAGPPKILPNPRKQPQSTARSELSLEQTMRLSALEKRMDSLEKTMMLLVMRK